MQENKDVIAIYSRKSRFTGKGESISNQVDMCLNYIRTVFGKNSADTAVVFEDEGFSGGNLNRPGFKKMMKSARDRQFRMVVVYRLDRISRNISDFSSLIEELGRLDIDFVSIRENFDTSSPMGRAMMYIASVFSQLERETIAERIRDNMHELAKTGRWLGGITPTGYSSESVKIITNEGKIKKFCNLKLVPEEAVIIRKIYDLYSETNSLTMTETELLRQHVKTKTGCNFTRFSIKSILQNPVYLIADQDAYQYFSDNQAHLFSNPEEFDGTRGILAYNRTDQDKGRSTIYLPISEWIVSVGQHPGIIPSKTWIRIQQALERNKSGAYRKPRNNKALLTGLLWCSCGNRMYPKLSNQMASEGHLIYRYVCKMKERSKGTLCNQYNVQGNLLDTSIIEKIKQLTGDSDNLLSELKKKPCFSYINQKHYNRKLEELQKQQMEIHRKINVLVDSLTHLSDSTSITLVQKRINEFHSQSTALQSQIKDLKNLCSQHILNDIELNQIRQQLCTFQNCVNHMTTEQKRIAIRTIVHKVVWDGQYAHVILWGTADEDFNYNNSIQQNSLV